MGAKILRSIRFVLPRILASLTYKHYHALNI